MKVKIITAILSVVLVAGAGVAAYFYINQNKKPTKETTSVETTAPAKQVEQARSYLTGEYCSSEEQKLRPYAVMINNIEAAIPQYGISKADIIYECPVEGSITRLMAIFPKPNKMKRIGSIRSCRIYYAYISKEWDSIYCHYGQSKYAKKFLHTKKIDNICSWNGEGAFYRTSDKPAPHNCYASGKGLNKERKKLKYRKNHKDTYKGHFKFAPMNKPYEIDNGIDATKVVVGYPYNNATYKYNNTKQKYYRFQYGNKHIDAVNNKQLSCTNIIIQYVKTVLYPDGKSLKMTQNGDGKGWYITRGKAMKITWHKDKLKSGQTKYYDDKGQEITLNNGKTFIQVVQKEDKGKTKIKGDKKSKKNS